MSNRRVIVAMLLVLAAAAGVFLLWSKPADSPTSVESTGKERSAPSAQAPATAPARAPKVPAAPAPVAEPLLRLPPAQVEQANDASQGAISGRVVSATTGLPVPRAEVTLLAPNGGAASSVTAEDGSFEYRPDAAGRYQIASVRAEGFVPFGPEWGRSPIAMTTAPGVRVRDVVIALLPATQMVGQVVIEKGEAVPGAHARVLYANAGEAALYPQKERFTADAQGEFRFEASEGASVEAWHPKHGAARASLQPPDVAAGRIVLRLAPTDVKGRAELSGRVLLPDGHGAPQALVWARSANSIWPKVHGDPMGYRATTDEEGAFEFTDLEPGLYDVTSQMTGLAPARKVDVKVPAKDVTLQLESGAKLTGTVRNAAGAPVPAFGVDLRWKRGPLEATAYEVATFVGPDGAYVVRGLRPGSYLVQVLATGFVTGEQQVQVAEGAEEVRADFRLERGGTIRGRVVTEGTARPVQGARVGVEGIAGGALAPSFSAVTDERGEFAIDGIPSSGVSLFVSAPGHNAKVVQAVRPGTHEVSLSAAAHDAGPRVELVGIGAVLKPRGDALVVGEVFPGGGAAEAGLQPADELITLDGKPVVEVGWPAAVGVIRGEAGTQLIVGVRKAGKPPVKTIAVTRKKIGA